MLIFDSFPTQADADAFARAVMDDYPDLSAFVYMDAESAQAADPIPSELHVPIVHVERPYSADDATIVAARELGMDGEVQTGAEVEAAIEARVASFGGRFVGT